MAKLFQLTSVPFDVDAQAERLYVEYPRKASKGRALKAIKAALKTTPFSKLHEAVVEYAKAMKASGKNKRYIPYAATWFNGQCWLDDRDDWWQGAVDAEAIAAYQRLAKFARKHGLRHPVVDDPDFRRAKAVAKLCNGGWAGFCDGRVSESEFVQCWRLRK